MPKIPSQHQDYECRSNNRCPKKKDVSANYFIFFRVCANRALLPSLPGFFAAAASFFAGIGFPFFAPSDLRSDPGLDTASLIHFSAMFFSSGELCPSGQDVLDAR